MNRVDPAFGTFTKRELERLEAYRAAVAAGFYTDQYGSGEAADTDVLAELRDEAGVTTDEVYPFTAEERLRLERCRAAVAGGYYRDDQPPGDAGAASAEASR
jgi:hypothetical protein